MDEQSDRRGEMGRCDEVRALIPRGRDMTTEEQMQFLGSLFVGSIGEDTPRIKSNGRQKEAL